MPKIPTQSRRDGHICPEIIEQLLPRAHENIQLYTGMRTKGCRKLVEPDPKCKSATRIAIKDEWIELFSEELNSEEGYWEILSVAETERIAIADGFDSFEEMKTFFSKTHGLPFEGVLIKW